MNKYGSGEWKSTPAPAIKGRADKEAYADMPAALEAYIKAMPEFDADIWCAITGREE